MGRSIIKLTKDERDYYLEFSSVVDAPVSFGLTLEEFTEQYREKEGTRAMEWEFPERMKRVEEKGTSSHMYDSVQEELAFNRAGAGETCLTVEQIIDAYCVNTEWAECRTPEEVKRGKQCPLVGRKVMDE